MVHAVHNLYLINHGVYTDYHRQEYLTDRVIIFIMLLLQTY